MKKQCVSLAVLILCWTGISFSQASGLQTSDSGAARTSTSASVSNQGSSSSVPAAAQAMTAEGNFVSPLMMKLPWERTVFLDGGLGTSGETGDHFLNAGVRLGKILTDPRGAGPLRGQFEYAIELIPYWQAFTPKQTYPLVEGNPPQQREVTTGGTYTGLSITPIILRWNMVRWKRVMPWVQAAGGLIWTNHKFPPNGTRGTSVWNFEPQGGLGFHYFLKPKQSFDFAADAVHISNASLGDANPGVNATVRFQIGYTWWK